MKIRTKTWSLMMIVLTPTLIYANDQLEKMNISSPMGKYKVTFKELRHYIAPPHTGDADDVNHIRYAVKIINNKNRETYEANYTDVYAYENDTPPGPTNIKNIYSSFVWSPKEDYVVLPEEQWSGYAASPIRKAINLNKTYKWSNATVQMNFVVWADDFRVFGNVYGDCDDHVSMFNGKTGETITVVPNTIFIGYKIISVRRNELMIKNNYSNCTGEEERKDFVGECEIVDMNSLSRHKIICPKCQLTTGWS